MDDGLRRRRRIGAATFLVIGALLGVATIFLSEGEGGPLTAGLLVALGAAGLTYRARGLSAPGQALETQGRKLIIGTIALWLVVTVAFAAVPGTWKAIVSGAGAGALVGAAFKLFTVGSRRESDG